MLDDRLERVSVTRIPPLMLPTLGKVWLSAASTPYLVLCFIFLVVFVAIAPIMDYVRFGTWRDARMMLGCMSVFAIPAGLVFFSMAQNHERPYRARQIARRGCCPACGVDLTGVAPSDDGLKTCPACASVWNMETAYLAKSARRTAAQLIIDDRGVRHIAERWIPGSAREVYSWPSKWWGDAPLRRFMLGRIGRFVGFWCAWFLAIALLPDDFLHWLPWSYIVLGIVLMIATIRDSRECESPGDAVEHAFFPKGRCRVCLEPLVGIAADEDGCTTCPSCSAAWRVGAITA